MVLSDSTIILIVGILAIGALLFSNTTLVGNASSVIMDDCLLSHTINGYTSTQVAQVGAQALRDDPEGALEVLLEKLKELGYVNPVIKVCHQQYTGKQTWP